jgi:hypothetical protein
MDLLPNHIRNKLAFLAPQDVPTSNFSFDQGLMNRWRTQLMYTHDAALLSQQEYQLFFVYGRHMAGQHDFKDIAPYVLPTYSTAFTSRKFCNWRKNLGSLSFPVAMETDRQDSPASWTDVQGNRRWFNDAPPACIRGQLYYIRSEAFYNFLDKDFRNGYNFIRKKVKIVSVHRQSESPYTEYKSTVWAWMYVGHEENWNKQFNGETGMMFFSPVRLEDAPHHLIPAHSFFELPTGAPVIEEESKPLMGKKLIYKPIPMIETLADGSTRVVGNGFETEWVEAEITIPPNPYASTALVDGASPVQRTVNEE